VHNFAMFLTKNECRVMELNDLKRRGWIILILEELAIQQ
jgi:hypothetical protein